LAWSRHQYAEVVRDQSVATWLACHRHAFEWFNGVPRKAPMATQTPPPLATSNSPTLMSA
jgi:transposase